MKNCLTAWLFASSLAVIGCSGHPNESKKDEKIVQQNSAVASAGTQAQSTSNDAPNGEGSTVADPAILTKWSTCSRDEETFWQFFNDFVSDEVIRSAHTASNVEIRKFGDPRTRMGVESARQNSPFKIVLSDNMWSYGGSSVAGDAVLPRVELKLRVEGEHMRMDFVRAEYSADDEVVSTSGPPGAYVFGHKRGCWLLEQELR